MSRFAQMAEICDSVDEVVDQDADHIARMTARLALCVIHKNCCFGSECHVYRNMHVCKRTHDIGGNFSAWQGLTKNCKIRVDTGILPQQVVKEARVYARQVGRKTHIGCNFYPVGEYLRFVRIPENLQVGDEVLRVEVHP
ncbi:hypothetical protein SFRURICE_020002, partial [Spodoptera frugiperda]